jgi:hypothetical protein
MAVFVEVLALVAAAEAVVVAVEEEEAVDVEARKVTKNGFQSPSLAVL